MLGAKLVRAYFDYVYNPIYDFTTARLNRYHRLQKECVDKFTFNNGHKILCIGLGTGNEVIHVFKKHQNASIVGIDYSKTALKKAYRKAIILNKQIEIFNMDARCLEFETGTFDEALCIHVMDFIAEKEKVIDEILRVLKDDGQFVVTYPSSHEGLMLGLNLFKDNIRQSNISGKNPILAFFESIANILVGIIYLPLLFRPGRKAYSRTELETIISKLPMSYSEIFEDPVYQDFIVYGKK
ncbi:class I SAM-dependent methyltransferase [Chloroflexota bacterium]